MKMKRRWTTLFSVFLVICVVSRVSRASDEVKTVGESLSFPIRVSTSGSIMFEGKTIGQVTEGNSVAFREFKDRLQWSNGFFTISHLRTNDSGVYTIDNAEEGKRSFYHVDVYETVSKPELSRQNHDSPESENCRLQCSVRSVTGLSLFWFRENLQLNQTNSSSHHHTLNLPLEVRTGDSATFSCKASNPVSQQITTANLAELCAPEHDISRRSYILIPAVCCVVFVVLVIGMIIFSRRKKREASRRSEDSSATEERQEEVQYTVINHTPKNQTQKNVRESSSQETCLLTTVYDHIHPYQPAASSQSESA